MVHRSDGELRALARIGFTVSLVFCLDGCAGDDTNAATSGVSTAGGAGGRIVAGTGGARNEGGPGGAGGQLEGGVTHEAGEPSVIRSSKPRASAASATPAAIADVVEGNTAFAFDVYGELRKTAGNLAFSPFSISMATAMVWAGSQGQAETDIANAFHFTRAQTEVHAALNALDQTLEGGTGGGFVLHIANAIWANPGSVPKSPFLDTLALYYGAGLRLIDLTNGTVAAPAINGWVSDETKGHITDIVAPSDFSSKTLLALANAIYFSGKWTAPFDPSRTHSAVFHRKDGTVGQEPTMAETVWTGYAKGADYEAAEFPYDGGSTQPSMLVIMPASGAFDAFEASLDAAKLDAIVTALSTHVVDAELPRFDLSSAPEMRSALEALGLGQLFVDVGSDFAPMMTPAPRYIQKFLHRATVAIDEQGTDASAATVIILAGDAGVSPGEASVPPPAIFHADRPFIFVIRDRVTRSVLFVGRVMDPAIH